jgi:hypothetical protein
MPKSSVQIKAVPVLLELMLYPMTTLPSGETAYAELAASPGRWPKPAIPSLAVQRNARELLSPTTTKPSAETAHAELEE